jgi:hypothetical protein
MPGCQGGAPHGLTTFTARPGHAWLRAHTAGVTADDHPAPALCGADADG